MRGGARPNAGRKPGKRNKKTIEIQERAAASGMLPHEFLCAVSQGQVFDGHEPTFAERMKAAADSAPFYAPKLASVDNKLSGTLGYTPVVVSERDPIPVAESRKSNGAAKPH